jgi:hypothetical protein
MKNTMLFRHGSAESRAIFGLLAGLALAGFGAAQNVGQAPYSTSSGAGIPANAPDEVKVTFDAKEVGIIYFETNGKRYKVNTFTHSMELVPADTSTPQPSSAASVAPPAAKQDNEEDYYAYETGDEPFDYRLVNVPTAKKVPKGTWNMSFTHRFSQPLRPFSESGQALLGFDSMSMSSFGIMYGITNKFYLNAYRSPVCQRSLCRTIEIGAGYHFTDQDERSPLAVSIYGSVEGNDNFTKQYTYNLQTMLSRRFGKRVFLHFAPAVHINSNGQRRFDPNPADYTPPDPALAFRQPAHTFSFGTGINVRITPTVSGIFEFTPRTGFKLGQVQPIFDPDFNVTGFKSTSFPEMGIGVQYLRGKHSFTITLSNTQTTTTSRYNSSNLVLKPKDLVIGFNLFRRW